MMHGNGVISVPPGFRFHPTDEELVYYYLKKKVSYEPIDLDVIMEVDLNSLEPWDLKEKCRIGSGPQNEWYFFSHKDKKYPTGSRTNRATTAGFWKATGRDKAIYLSNGKKIGMRKTLVFYTGRAPHGHKTDWIMHEYRLDDDRTQLQQEDGWVVCRVFQKKNPGRGIQAEIQQEEDYDNHTPQPTYTSTTSVPQLHKNYTQHSLMIPSNYSYPLDGTMQLPQLSSPDSVAPMDNLLMRLGPSIGLLNAPQMLTGGGDRVSVNGGGEWGFLDKLLVGYQSLEQQQAAAHGVVGETSSVVHRQNKLPFL